MKFAIFEAKCLHKAFHRMKIAINRKEISCTNCIMAPLIMDILRIYNIIAEVGFDGKFLICKIWNRTNYAHEICPFLVQKFT